MSCVSDNAVAVVVLFGEFACIYNLYDNLAIMRSFSSAYMFVSVLSVKLINYAACNGR